MSNDYDFGEQTLPFLDAGVFSEKLTRAFREACAATAAHGENKKKGKVTIELTIERIGESAQVNVSHKLSTTKPTEKGKVSEENTTETPLHVTADGPRFVESPKQVDGIGEPTKEQK